MSNEYVWTPSSTPIDVRWRRLYGWIPPSETAEGQEKFRKFRELTTREIPDVAVQQTRRTINRLKEKNHA